MTSALALALALTLSAAPGPPAGAPDLSVRFPAVGPGHGAEADCSACHTADGWDRVSFAHERTGFALEGRHREASCRACHPGGDFRVPVAVACAACHRDAHGGRLGARCGRCHAATTWRETTFDPLAHRRSAFPLSGRHAIIPCEECHGDRRDRSFARPTADCVACHEPDALRGNARLPGHDRLGPACRACHGAWRFSPASFPAHEACFPIRSGKHGGIRCADCHVPSVPPVSDPTFACASGTADCVRCHACTKMQEKHRAVASFQCTSPRCYECHPRGSED